MLNFNLLQVLYSPAAYGVDLASQNAPKPRARINANLCVVKNTLWLFGGIVEIGDKEVCTVPEHSALSHHGIVPHASRAAGV